MKRSELSVVIGCEWNRLQEAIALRGVLEAFGHCVHLYQLVRKQQVLDFLAGPLPEHDYIIWCCHGLGDTPEDTQLIFSVIDQVEQDDEQKSGWEYTDFILTPSDVSRYLKNPQGTLICAAVPEIWAKAFLEVGYQAFIGPAPGAIDVDIDSNILFITGFFYHLNMHRRNYTDRIYTPQEAVVAAAAMDTHYHCGTKVFHYYAH